MLPKMLARSTFLGVSILGSRPFNILKVFLGHITYLQLGYSYREYLYLWHLLPSYPSLLLDLGRFFHFSSYCFNLSLASFMKYFFGKFLNTPFTTILLKYIIFWDSLAPLDILFIRPPVIAFSFETTCPLSLGK